MTNEELVEQIQEAGADERQQLYGQLYEQNVPLIRLVARRYACTDFPLEDLMQEAYFTLIRSADTYRPDKGARFSTLFCLQLGQHLFRIRSERGSVHRSEAKERLLLAYYRLSDEYQRLYSRRPTDGEISACLGLSMEAAQRIRQEAGYTIVSLQAPIGGEDGDITLEDSLRDPVDHYEETEEDIQSEQLAAMLWAEVDKLTDRQREIILRRYRRGQTMQQAGEEMGLSYGTLRQAEHDALHALKKDTALQDFLEASSSPYYATSLSSYNRTFTSAPELAVLRTYRRRTADYRAQADAKIAALLEKYQCTQGGNEHETNVEPNETLPQSTYEGGKQSCQKRKRLTVNWSRNTRPAS